MEIMSDDDGESDPKWKPALSDNFTYTVLQPFQSVDDLTKDLPLTKLKWVEIFRVHKTNLMVKKPLHSPLLELHRLQFNRQARPLFILQPLSPHQGKIKIPQKNTSA